MIYQFISELLLSLGLLLRLPLVRERELELLRDADGEERLLWERRPEELLLERLLAIQKVGEENKKLTEESLVDRLERVACFSLNVADDFLETSFSGGKIIIR